MWAPDQYRAFALKTQMTTLLVFCLKMTSIRRRWRLDEIESKYYGLMHGDAVEIIKSHQINSIL